MSKWPFAKLFLAFLVAVLCAGVLLVWYAKRQAQKAIDESVPGRLWNFINNLLPSWAQPEKPW